MSTYSGAGVGLTIPASVALAGESSCSRDWHQVASCKWTIIVVSAFNILQQPRQQVVLELKKKHCCTRGSVFRYGGAR